ncbi:MAG: hypothetical protein P4L63_01465 [Candidatus Pacebacteria bacterium]|nr:hypothetical protein [Candidatus Paceibacterota bacterium]
MKEEIDDNVIDDILVAAYPEYKTTFPERYIDHYLEQYRIYLLIFDNLSDRRQKSNEFFLAINTAIMGIMGYFEIKTISDSQTIFVLVPLVGMAICFCWYRMILSYSQLNRAKFKVIHTLEQKLPAKLFDTEWQILGGGKNRSKYFPLSHAERFIPIIFIVLYIIIFIVNSPVAKFLSL